MFNIKHKVGSSSSPYNRAATIGKHRLWDELQSIRHEDEKASVYLRSHVHYFSYCGESDWVGFTLPALQSNQTKYGARQCVGATDWGLCMFKVENNEFAGYDCRLFTLSSNKKRVIQL